MIKHKHIKRAQYNLSSSININVKLWVKQKRIPPSYATDYLQLVQDYPPSYTELRLKCIWIDGQGHSYIPPKNLVCKGIPNNGWLPKQMPGYCNYMVTRMAVIDLYTNIVRKNINNANGNWCTWMLFDIWDTWRFN